MKRGRKILIGKRDYIIHMAQKQEGLFGEKGVNRKMEKYNYTHTREHIHACTYKISDAMVVRQRNIT